VQICIGTFGGLTDAASSAQPHLMRQPSGNVLGCLPVGERDDTNKEEFMTAPAPTLQFTNIAELYERMLVEPLFRPFAQQLIARVQPQSGDRLLDVACGTGIVARLAQPLLGRNARLVAVDASPHMIGVGRSVTPDIDFREGNAQALPLEPGEQFDIVTCHQGLQFFPDRPHALAEMRRALAGGGRLAIGTWRPVEEMPFLGQLQRVVEQHTGAIVDARHGLGDDRNLYHLLTEAGFDDVEIETTTLPVRFEDWTVFVRLNANALMSMSPLGKDLDEARRADLIATIIEESRAVLGSHLSGDALTYELGSNLAIAKA
jgi:ubiquinone/menaquinone biosynthesis C-methylase UbiE